MSPMFSGARRRATGRGVVLVSILAAFSATNAFVSPGALAPRMGETMASRRKFVQASRPRASTALRMSTAAGDSEDNALTWTGRNAATLALSVVLAAGMAGPVHAVDDDVFSALEAKLLGGPKPGLALENKDTAPSSVDPAAPEDPVASESPVIPAGKGGGGGFKMSTPRFQPFTPQRPGKLPADGSLLGNMKVNPPSIIPKELKETIKQGLPVPPEELTEKVRQGLPTQEGYYRALEEVKKTVNTQVPGEVKSALGQLPSRVTRATDEPVAKLARVLPDVASARFALAALVAFPFLSGALNTAAANSRPQPPKAPEPEPLPVVPVTAGGDEDGDGGEPTVEDAPAPVVEEPPAPAPAPVPEVTLTAEELVVQLEQQLRAKAKELVALSTEAQALSGRVNELSEKNQRLEAEVTTLRRRPTREEVLRQEKEREEMERQAAEREAKRAAMLAEHQEYEQAVAAARKQLAEEFPSLDGDMEMTWDEEEEDDELDNIDVMSVFMKDTEKPKAAAAGKAPAKGKGKGEGKAAEAQLEMSDIEDDNLSVMDLVNNLTKPFLDGLDVNADDLPDDEVLNKYLETVGDLDLGEAGDLDDFDLDALERSLGDVDVDFGELKRLTDTPAGFEDAILASPSTSKPRAGATATATAIKEAPKKAKAPAKAKTPAKTKAKALAAKAKPVTKAKAAAAPAAEGEALGSPPSDEAEWRRLTPAAVKRKTVRELQSFCKQRGLSTVDAATGSALKKAPLLDVVQGYLGHL